MNIPFVDLKAQYFSIKNEIDAEISTILENASFVGGQPVKEFEEDFSKFIGLKHVIGCGNGTDSIEIMLKAIGLGPGDEVIVPAISWISSSEAVSAVGATPVFVDVEEDYLTINPSAIQAKISSKTKAIIPVHLYGQSANMPEIVKLAKANNLFIIEDCAQSHGAKINGQLSGTFGDCSSFSFYPGKNLGAYGDAGGMATNNERIAEVSRMIANHGQKGKHNHLMEGRNSRLDTLQAAILKVKLRYLDSWNDSRIKNASLYSELLKDISGLRLPQVRANSKHVFHLYVIRTEKRQELANFLKANAIETAIHYPTALPFLPCYAHLKHKTADFPVAAKAQNEILSVPMYAELSEEMIHWVCSKIKEWAK